MSGGSLAALLEPIQGRLDAITPGPWECDGFAGEGVVDLSIFKGSNQGPTIVEGISRHEDAEFFMNAPTDTARLLAAVKAVTDLHERRAGEYRDMHGQCWIGDYCVECRDEWPCPTAVEIEAVLGGEA